MTSNLFKLSLVAGGVLAALQAAAHAPVPAGAPAASIIRAASPSGPVARPASQAPITSAARTVAAAGSRLNRVGMSETITAAGSVIVLADGIVANAASAQILPPAPGFVYEP